MFKKMGFNGLALALAALVWLLPDAAQATEISSGNTAWILTSTALVLFMTLPGLALFYAGLVQSKNVLSVMMHCFAIACLVSVLWLVAGYSLAFSEGNALVGDLSKAFHDRLSKKMFPDKKLLTTDGVHMNPRGNRLMARSIVMSLGATYQERRRAENRWELVNNIVEMGE